MTREVCFPMGGVEVRNSPEFQVILVNAVNVGWLEVLPTGFRVAMVEQAELSTMKVDEELKMNRVTLNYRGAICVMC